MTRRLFREASHATVACDEKRLQATAMKKKLVRSIALCVFGMLATVAHATEDETAWKAGMTNAHGKPQSAALPWVNGEVEDVDIPNSYVIVRHEPIPNLNMDAMTMAFAIKDPALLSKLKAGDKIRFTAKNIGEITTIMSLKIPR
jgi:Cu/Ag efflux protein CusF